MYFSRVLDINHKNEGSPVSTTKKPLYHMVRPIVDEQNVAVVAAHRVAVLAHS